MGFHSASLARVFNNPVVDGVIIETPKVKPHSHRAGRGVIGVFHLVHGWYPNHCSLTYLARWML